MIDTCQKLLITPRGDLSTPGGVIDDGLVVSVVPYSRGTSHPVAKEM